MEDKDTNILDQVTRIYSVSVVLCILNWKYIIIIIIIKSRNNKSKVNFIRKQIGSGVLDDICMLIIPIILTLL